MERVNEVFGFITAVEERLAQGQAVRDAAIGALESLRDRTLRREIFQVVRAFEEPSRESLCLGAATTSYRRSLMSILLDGHRGRPILPRLLELRLEVERQLELDAKAHIEALPIKLLAPLLLLMFPAFLILLLGPILKQLLEVLER